MKSRFSPVVAGEYFNNTLAFNNDLRICLKFCELFGERIKYQAIEPTVRGFGTICFKFKTRYATIPKAEDIRGDSKNAASFLQLGVSSLESAQLPNCDSILTIVPHLFKISTIENN